jgi:hypothetical protein
MRDALHNECGRLRAVTLGGALRSTAGRLAMFAFGLGLVTWIVHRIGIDTVGAALSDAAPYFGLIVALEACVIGCQLRALRTLYGEAARNLPARQLIRAGLVGYALSGIIPGGSAVAEATRATMVARYVGKGRAGAAAARMQAVSLVANGIISVPCGIAVLTVVGAGWLPLAIAINTAACFGIGFGLLAVARHGRVGAWLGRRWKRAREFGAEMDAAFAGEPIVPKPAIAWETLGRVSQVIQNGVLVVCVGGAFGAVPALTSEGIHLVAAMVGYVVPANLGATEGNYTLAAGALHLTTAASVSIALLAHLAQVVWITVGILLFVTRRSTPSGVSVGVGDRVEPPSPAVTPTPTPAGE